MAPKPGVQSCLAKDDPQRRYLSALILAEDLAHWLKREPIETRRAGSVAHRREWVQRNPAVAAVSFLGPGY